MAGRQLDIGNAIKELIRDIITARADEFRKEFNVRFNELANDNAALRTAMAELGRETTTIKNEIRGLKRVDRRQNVEIARQNKEIKQIADRILAIERHLGIERY